MNAYWSQVPTDTDPPSYTTTGAEDVILPLDATALLVGGGAPSAPTATLYRLVDGGADVAVALPDTPTLGTPPLVNQRIRGLAGHTVYRLFVSFTTGGQIRTMSRVIVVVE